MYHTIAALEGFIDGTKLGLKQRHEDMMLAKQTNKPKNMNAKEARAGAEKATPEIIRKEIESAANQGLTSYTTPMALSKELFKELQDDGFTLTEFDWGQVTGVTQGVVYASDNSVVTKIEW